MPVFTGPSRTLLITLDAFGTLYRPRKSIAAQYLDVAKSCGLAIEADTAEFGQSFKKAFKSHQLQLPNYGRATGMRPEAWWAGVVKDTFGPLVRAGEPIPEILPTVLFHHFSSQKGYELFPDVVPFFRRIKSWKQRMGPEMGVNKILVGVATNSDPRVAGVLRSLGVTVGDDEVQDLHNDVDFVLTSYDCGQEKPSPFFFREVEQMARTSLGMPKSQRKPSDNVAECMPKVHIGNDPHKDYWGAIRSGRSWDAILLARDSNEDQQPLHDVQHITKLTDAQAALMALLQRSQV